MNEHLGTDVPSSNKAEAELDRLLDEALGRAPEVTIPADFASRLASSLPRRRSVRLPSPRFAPLAMAASLLLLLAALLLSAPRLAAYPSLGALAIQWTLCGAAVLLAAFLGPLRGRWRSLE